jgi:hypothetical protein
MLQHGILQYKITSFIGTVIEGAIGAEVWKRVQVGWGVGE